MKLIYKYTCMQKDRPKFCVYYHVTVQDDDMYFFDCRITSRARNLLKLIPTDPSVQDTLESLGHKVTTPLPWNSVCEPMEHNFWYCLPYWYINCEHWHCLCGDDSSNLLDK